MVGSRRSLKSISQYDVDNPGGLKSKIGCLIPALRILIPSSGVMTANASTPPVTAWAATSTIP